MTKVSTIVMMLVLYVIAIFTSFNDKSCDMIKFKRKMFNRIKEKHKRTFILPELHFSIFNAHFSSSTLANSLPVLP